MKLYYFETPNARKACVVARYLNSPVEFVRVDLTKGEHKAPAFLAINPNGKVPALEDGDVRLWESAAIIDCDYYVSTRQIFERLIDHIPSGCVVYFDEIEYNFGSRFTGEMRAVAEINSGSFGDDVELVLDRALTWNTNRVYRFINLNAKSRHRLKHRVAGDPVRYRRDDSPFP